jgi:CofD-related protein of GAK system
MSIRLRINREVQLPNPIKLDRFRRMPELGPRILFFSGGSALYNVSRALVDYTHNSIHVVTPFDSGGSSARLRDEFDMPAIGDIRHRLMALADQSYHGNPQIFELFAHRLPKNRSQTQLRATLEKMAAGRHLLVSRIPNPMRKLIRTHLQKFLEFVSEQFDFRGASIGNLVLAAGYLDNRRHLDPVIYLFSRLVEVRGTVRPVVNRSYHLAVTLEDGTRLVGQHTFTGKEHGHIQSKIVSLNFVKSEDNVNPVSVSIRKKTEDLIRSADLICYPMGSFYSSILATILPSGVGRAVAANGCPKVFVPNTGNDPECFRLTLAEQVERLTEHICRDESQAIPPSDVVSIVLIDDVHRRYVGRLTAKNMARLGIEIVRYPLVSEKSQPFIDEHNLIPVLLSLC